MVLSRFTDRAEAETLARRILEAVGGDPFRLQSEKEVFLTCSVGWAAFPWFLADPERVKYEEVIRIADLALYQAKRSGRNRAIGLLANQDSQAANAFSVPTDHLDPEFPVRTVNSAGPTRPLADQHNLAASESSN